MSLKREEILELVREIKDSEFLPPSIRGNEANVAYVVLTGMELGLSPMQALRAFYPSPVIDRNTGQQIGLQLGMHADAMLAIMYNQGYKFPRMEFTDQYAYIEAIRPDGQQYSIKYTIEDAKRAGLLNRRPYATHPKRMLRARAIGYLFRDIAPQVGSNIYEPDELREATETATAEHTTTTTTHQQFGNYTVASREHPDIAATISTPINDHHSLDEPQEPPAELSTEPEDQLSNNTIDQPEDQDLPAIDSQDTDQLLPPNSILTIDQAREAMDKVTRNLMAKRKVPDKKIFIKKLLEATIGPDYHNHPDLVCYYLAKAAYTSNLLPDLISTGSVQEIASTLKSLADPVSKALSQANLDHLTNYSFLVYAVLANTPQLTPPTQITVDTAEKVILSIVAAHPDDRLQKIKQLAQEIA